MSDTLYSFCSEDCLDVFGDPGFDNKLLEVADSEGVQPSVEEVDIHPKATTSKSELSRKGEQNSKGSSKRIVDNKTVSISTPQGVALEEVEADSLDNALAKPSKSIFSVPSRSLEDNQDKHDEAVSPSISLEEPITADDDGKDSVIAKEQNSEVTKPDTGIIELKLPISEPNRETKHNRKSLEEEDNEIVDDENLTPLLQELTVKNTETDNNEQEDTIARPKECFNLKSSTCHKVLAQMNDAVLLMVTTGIYQKTNGTKLRIMMKLFHTLQEINIITILPNTYFIICFIQSAHEQYLDVCTVSVEGCLCEDITGVKDEEYSVSFSERKQVLCDILQNSLHMCNIKILHSLL